MDKFRPGRGTPEYDIPSDEQASEVRLGRGRGEGMYPSFDHVAGAPAVGIGDKLFIPHGEPPTRCDATDHLFGRGERE